ncbi:MAG: FAD binding domain-containing protein [bacterium]
MQPNITDYLQPKSLPEAIALMATYAGRAALVGGGLDLSWRPRQDIQILIGLDRIPLSYIEWRPEGLVIGAGTTLRELADSNGGSYLNGLFGRILDRIATPLLRGMITVGGALARAYPWSDLLPIFLGCQAHITLFDGQDHTIPLESFYQGSFRQLLKRSIIRELCLPPHHQSFAAYQRFGRLQIDIPLLNQFSRLTLVEEQIEKASLWLGARPGFPVRLSEVEAVLLGKPLNQVTIGAAVSVLSSSLVGADFRLSKEYRHNLATVFLRRNLTEIWSQHATII